MEQPLLPNESCNLGSINLANMLDSNNKLDWRRLTETTMTAVRFLDDVIDANKYPLEQIRDATLRTRKIGLGVMGFHDMLIKMGIPYDDPRALELGRDIMKQISFTADNVSCGVDEKPKNATRTTIAPTGTISILAEVSSGIEPVFSWAYTRKDTTGERVVVHPLFTKALMELNEEINACPKEVIEILMRDGTIQNIPWLPVPFKSLFKSALDIDYKIHIKMQAAFQESTDNAVSKTINMLNTATRDDIKHAIILAWQSGCKGLTIYRAGSRDEEVLCLNREKVSEKLVVNSDNIIDWVEDEFYEEVTPAYIYKVRSGCGKFYVIVGHDGESPTKVFVEGDGTGGCQGNMAALGRSISVGLDSGTSPTSYVKQFGRVKCNTAMNNKDAGGKSCADIVGKSINNVINRLDCIHEQDCTIPSIVADTMLKESNKHTTESQNSKCCDNPKYIMQEGCQVCLNCGRSKCS